MIAHRHLSIAIPAMAEFDTLPSLIDRIVNQTYKNLSLYICVNNPQGWQSSTNEWEHDVYVQNQKSLDFLRSLHLPNIYIIDHSSQGQPPKRTGVGWARKSLLDAISFSAHDDELIVSLDADTSFSHSYFQSLVDYFAQHPQISAVAVPYYHPLSGNDALDRPLLRYEIYMRHYAISLLESNNPYAFTALGSAMAFTLAAYRKVGGFSPLQAGEDFYLLQKFVKSGCVALGLDETVYPQGRSSQRVPFGTGPAVGKGLDSMNNTYPFYPEEAFAEVSLTFAAFPKLFLSDVNTPMSAFLCQQLKCDNPWTPLRKNFKSPKLFVRACRERVDGLRILQFLHTFPLLNDIDVLRPFCNSHGINLSADFSFSDSPIGEINQLRNDFFALEYSLRHLDNSFLSI